MCVSRPFPELSARLNAWATSFTCTWLMGSMSLNDVEFEDGKVRSFVSFNAKLFVFLER